ncbi:MAG: sugar ABC transporter permease, partial [Candidatus Dormibacteraeota bacterium]|nr:sugar ABC transporter permease [Candidatus Dormibacteraeota bacterium]
MQTRLFQTNRLLARRPPAHSLTASRQLWAYLFILPTVVFFLVFIAIPFFRALAVSLTEWAGYDQPRFIGLQNFFNLTQDRIFWLAMRNSITYTAATTILQTAIPMGIAVLLNAGWRGSVFFRTAVFVPVIISSVVSGLLWRMIYDANFGVLNTALNAIGLGRLTLPWLADPRTVLPAIIAVSLWQSLGFYMLIFFAGLQSISAELYEAASIDGATSSQKFRYVTVPMLWPVTAVVVTLNIIAGVKVFDVIYIMTTGGPDHASEVLGTYLYVTSFGASGGGSPSMGYAA